VVAQEKSFDCLLIVKLIRTMQVRWFSLVDR